jgi:hypothetical protein
MTAATPKITKAARNSQLLAGVTKRFTAVPNMQTFPVGGAMLSVAQIEAELEPIVNAGAAVPPTKAAWQAAVQAQRTADASGAPFLTALKATVYVLFGNQPEVLADFGLLPKKPKKSLTTSLKVVASARRQATRTLRNPIKPSVRKTLKGAIGATIEIPVPGAVVPPPQPQPQPAAPPPQQQLQVQPAALPAAGGMVPAGGGGAPGGNGSGPHT